MRPQLLLQSQSFRSPIPRTLSSLLLCSALIMTAPTTLAQDDDDEIPFDVAEVFIELNDTDGDLGIHALIDGEPWKKLVIEDPYERRILKVTNRGRLRRQGLTELFFESAEPSFDELSPEAFFHRFPEGIYEVEGVTIEGDELESEATFTHVMPAPPGNIMVAGQGAAEDCDASPLPLVVDGAVLISWDEVTESHPDLGRYDPDIEILGYHFVAAREEPVLLEFTLDLSPETTEVVIPASFIAQGEEFKFEILVREASGNKTAVESCFEVDR